MPKTLNFDRMNEVQLAELFALDNEISAGLRDDVLLKLLETSIDVVGKKRSG